MTTSTFPGALDTISPVPADPENTELGAPGPYHDEHHQELADAVEAIESTIGEMGSTDPASIEYRLSSVITAASDAAAAAASAASDAATAEANAAAAALGVTDLVAALGTAAYTSTTAYATAAQGATADSAAVGLTALSSSLGTAATLNAGSGVGNLVQLAVAGQLPVLDGSQLTGLAPGGVTDYADLTGKPTLGTAAATAATDYAVAAKGVTNGDAHDHNGGDGAQIAYGSLSGLPTLGTAAAAATGDFEAAGAISTHNAVTTAHGISAYMATVLDDADQATARATLGLGNVDNTSDANKPVSTAQQTALNAKAPTASPTFTGTVAGITAAMVGAPSGSGTSTGANTGDSATPPETTNSIGALLNGATSKTTPVDADKVGFWDSVSGVLQAVSWENIKTTLSSTFVLLTGKAGGQKLIGGTGAADGLDLQATSGAGTAGSKVRVLVGNNGATTGLSIIENGNVGVGEPLPTEKFQISDPMSPTVSMKNTGTGGGTFFFLSTNNAWTVGGGRFVIGVNNTSSSNVRFVLDSVGNLGIGTGAVGLSSKLHVVATTEQFRLGYDAANYQSATVSSGGIPTWTSTGGAFIFQGDIRLDKTITASGTTGAMTINNTLGSVNFAAGASSLVVTNSRVTTSSVIQLTIASNDATMRYVWYAKTAGSFTIYANAAATAETRVDFQVLN